ncbi:MAG: DUF4258 domain-containing protein [Dehalococcoidia bacterium]|nr:hypothetical protein [Chloroflexota bacterium]MBT9159579.1 hypothetical protein [Chloroflexota bacterium]MBT9162577.1 hypothetical protein [Chloroflexota bacterium]
MNEVDVTDLKALLERVRAQAEVENIRTTQHAQQEMVEEDITLDEVLEAIATAQILENYPEHLRGACCLINGLTENGRPLHVVCTTVRPVLIIITVYEPKPPKWITPARRR